MAEALADNCAAASEASPCATLSSGKRVDRPLETGVARPPGEFILLGKIKGLALSQEDGARTTASFGGTWRLTTGIRYEAPGGLRFSGSALARHGYSLPPAMVQPLGTDVQLLPDSNNAMLEFGGDPTHWDTTLRVQKTISSNGPVSVTIVGEAINLQNQHVDRGATPSDALLKSRTFRLGVVLGF